MGQTRKEKKTNKQTAGSPPGLESQCSKEPATGSASITTLPSTSATDDEVANKPLRKLEVRKAAQELAGGKAPGPDTIPGELFERLTAIVPVIADLASTVLRTGRIPKPLR